MGCSSPSASRAWLIPAVCHRDSFPLLDRSSVSGCTAAHLGLSRRGLYAHQLESQCVYAVEDAVELRLVNDLACEDRLSAFRLHLHPFECCRVPLAELPSH